MGSNIYLKKINTKKQQQLAGALTNQPSRNGALLL
jgi:hypothetical protein